MAAREFHLGQLRQGPNFVVGVKGLGAGANVGALHIHRSACAGAIVPQQNRAAARTGANAMHKARRVELGTTVVIEGSAEAVRGVVLEPAIEGGETQM